MKKIYVIMFLTAFNVGLAQLYKNAGDFFEKENIPIFMVEDTLDIDPYYFFPMKVGNSWQYSEQGGYTSLRVVSKDSVLEDGSHFYYLGQIHLPWPQYRIDTNYNVYFDPNDWNRHYYKLDADIGERWWIKKDSSNGEFTQGYMAEVDTIYSGVYLGKSTIFKVVSTYLEYNNNGTIEEFWDHDEVLALGIGLIYEEKDGIQPNILSFAVIDGDTLGTIVGIKDETNNELPLEFSLNQNYPNPFNSITTVKYNILVSDFYSFQLFNNLGQNILTEKHFLLKGSYEHKLNLNSYTSGVYFFRLKNKNNYKMLKMIYLK